MGQNPGMVAGTGPIGRPPVVLCKAPHGEPKGKMTKMNLARGKIIAGIVVFVGGCFLAGSWILTRDRWVIDYLDGRSSTYWVWPWRVPGFEARDITGEGFSGRLTCVNWKGWPLYEQRYVDGQLCGYEKVFSILHIGQPIKWTEYLNGEQHGAHVDLFSDGRDRERGHYLNGRKHGTWVNWYPDGFVRFTEEYDRGSCLGCVWGDPRMDEQRRAILDYWHSVSPEAATQELRERALHFLKPGMTKEDVKDLLGPAAEEGDIGKRWHYVLGPKLSADNPAILFDDMGKVVGIVRGKSACILDRPRGM